MEQEILSMDRKYLPYDIAVSSGRGEKEKTRPNFFLLLRAERGDRRKEKSSSDRVT